MKTTIFSLATFGLILFGNECQAQTVSGEVGGFDYVDLGLSVRWATYNVGATTVTEVGDFFAWGETQPKDTYNWSTYKWCKGSYNTLTRYCIKKKLGKRDMNSALFGYDDAATTKWGSQWRMPDYNELEALMVSCKWSWDKDYKGSGIAGFVGTSKINGNTIFLPAGGYRENGEVFYAGARGQYMSRITSDEGDCDTGILWFGETTIESDFVKRYIGNNVRAVTDFAPVSKSTQDADNK